MRFTIGFEIGWIGLLLLAQPFLSRAIPHPPTRRCTRSSGIPEAREPLFHGRKQFPRCFHAPTSALWKVSFSFLGGRPHPAPLGLPRRYTFRVLPICLCKGCSNACFAFCEQTPFTLRRTPVKISIPPRFCPSAVNFPKANCHLF